MAIVSTPSLGDSIRTKSSAILSPPSELRITTLESLLRKLGKTGDSALAAEVNIRLAGEYDIALLMSLADRFGDDALVASPILRRVLELDPRNERALERLADILVAFHLPEADATVRSLQTSYPDNSKGVWLALQVLSPHDYFATLERLARRLCSLEPKEPWGAIYLAKVLAFQGRNDEALNELRRGEVHVSRKHHERLAVAREDITTGRLLTSWP